MADIKKEETNYAMENENVNVNRNIKSKFVQQICSILMVARILDWYQDFKTKNPLLSTAISPVEYLVTAPLLFVSSQFGTRFKYIDEKAAQITATMSEAVGQVCQQSLNKDDSSPMQSSKGKCVVRSIPGTAVTWFVDAIYYISDHFLRKLKTQSQRKPFEDTFQKQFMVQGFHNHGLLYVVVFPLEIYVSVLRYIHRWIHSSDDTYPPQHILSPEKMAEIQSRRKVSPRKKSKNLLVRLFGLGRPGNLQSISEEIKGELLKSPNKEDGVEKKRKYEDIETEQESEEEKYGLGDSDLEDYDSDEDPDYEPDNHNTTDSEEYAEGQTESDIEFEVKGSGYQVVEDDTAKTAASKPAVVVEDTPVKSVVPRDKPLSKSFVEGTPPSKTSTPRGKSASIQVEAKSKDALTTEKKIALSPGKPIQLKPTSPQVKVKQESIKNVEEKTIQMPTNAPNTEKKAVLLPGKSIQLKPGSPQVKAREAKEKSGPIKSENYHGKCKEEENVGLRTSSPQKPTQKTTKHKGSKKIENQGSVKETKIKGSIGSDASGDQKSKEKLNGEKPKSEKTEIKNINIAGGDFVSKESEID